MATATETKTESKAPALKDDVLALSKQIEAEMAIDKKTGIAPALVDVYAKTLPEEWSIESVNRLEAHNAKFIAAAHHAHGQVSVPVLEENKELESTESMINMGGKNVLSLTMDRKRVYPNPQDKENPIVKYGVITANYDVNADHNAGQLKVARTIINDLAASRLK